MCDVAGLADRERGANVGLSGTTWRAETGGADERDAAIPTVTFGVDGRLEGHAGVNRFVGTYRLKGARIEFGELATTKMAGPEDAMRREHELLSALSGTRPLSIAGDLLLIGDDDEGTRFRRIETSPGVGPREPIR